MSPSIPAAQAKTIIFACEAGTGSSLMSLNSLKEQLKATQISGMAVVHKAAREISSDVQLVVVHEGLVPPRIPRTLVVQYK